MIQIKALNRTSYDLKTLGKDLSAGLVVFLVALPLCLGIALASGAPAFSGILAGVVGGVVVGILSGSHTSVSGSAAGLSAVVASQIHTLGFDIFLTAVILAGVFQIFLAMARMGYIAAFFPSSVIKGLLAAIGIILILKQIPHILGYDSDPIGDDAFLQFDEKNTFTELFDALYFIHPGALFISLISVCLLVIWDKISILKKFPIPAPLIVVLAGVAINALLQAFGHSWAIESSHLVQVPVAKTADEFFGFLQFPNLTGLGRAEVYLAAVTIGLVASLESLLNVEAIDKVDPDQRVTPPNRELFAQGVGNMVTGFLGGIPITSVIIRSSVNINAGVKTKVSTIWHGILLFGCVWLIPGWLNKIPLSALAAILFMTGLKLASPTLMLQMWREGKNQFLPFIATITAIVFTDLLTGIIIGLCISTGFILHSNLRQPIKKTLEKHATGDQVLHIELPNQVGFFNRAALDRIFREIPSGNHVLLDATSCDYIDPDILDLIVDFQNSIAPAHDIQVSLKGFKNRYSQLEDRIQYIDFSYRELQDSLTPERVLEALKEGNRRFKEGTQIKRDYNRLLSATSEGQFPMAAVLSCIDSRTPVEIIFDLGLGDVFSIRIAGNVVSRQVIGSLEYSCAVAGAKLILVMGHTQCGAVGTAVELVCKKGSKTANSGFEGGNIDSLVDEIKQSVNLDICKSLVSIEKRNAYANEVAHRNVLRTISLIKERSRILDDLVKQGKIAIVGGMYNISTAEVTFFSHL